MVDDLDVSRNTLREAFRLLTHENLLNHELNRGIFVRELNAEDIEDIYRVRKIVECGAVRPISRPAGERLGPLRRAVSDGDAAARDERWQDLGTANIHFHEGIAGLAESERVDELMARIFAELRLGFHAMPDRRRFHEPYLAGNHDLLKLLEAGEGRRAADLLADYLDEAEAQLRNAYS
jgi:DNA-binding GntR family transcriptional regulator